MPNSKPPRRVDDPPHIDMTPAREESRDIWARLQTAYERFKLAWVYWVGFGIIFTWAMIHIVGPLESVPVLQAQIAKNDTVTRAKLDTVTMRLDKADSARTDMVQLLKVFGKFICLQMTDEDRYKYDVQCSNLPKPIIKNRSDPP